MTVDAQQPVREGIRLLTRGTTAARACRRAPKIFHEYDAQRDRDCPQLTDGQWLHTLIGAHEVTQRFGIESAVGVSYERPGHAEHAWIAVKGSIAQFG